jgi:MoxR-like ATPase
MTPTPQPLLADSGDIRQRLLDVGYLADELIADAVFLAGNLGKPLLVEGPAGVGKTELAKATAALTGSRLLRLQCYEGLDEAKALYEWNYKKQLLRIQAGGREEGGRSWEEAEADIFTADFLLERPLLAAIRATDPVLLLIDEVDRVEVETEALLLEVLSDFQVSIPELGTVTARQRPLVFLTSNATRELSEALRRRCLYLHIDYPDVERERRIIELRVPGIRQDLAAQAARVVHTLRGLDLTKPPSISETVDWARSLILLGIEELDSPAAARALPALVKNHKDSERAAAGLGWLSPCSARRWDEGDLPVRGSGHRARVQDRGDRLDAVDEARARADDEGVGVDGPGRHAGQRRRHGRGLLGRTLQVVAAGRDDDQVRGGVGDLLPAQLLGPVATAGRDRLAARGGHQVGYPVPGRERRVHPLDDRDPRPRAARDQGRHPGEALAEAGDDLRRTFGHAGALADGEDRAEHLLQRVRVERQHAGAAAEVVQCLRHVPGRQRAHPAQVLGEDQVRAQPRQRVRVQRVQVPAAGELVTDVGVDVGRGHPRGIPAAHHDFLFRTCGGWLVTLKRDSHQVIAQAERVDDLGRGRQQGYDAHTASIG